MKEKMSDDLRQAITSGRDSAIKYRDSKLRLEHVIYGILFNDNLISQIIKEKVKDFDSLITDIDAFNKRLSDNDDEIENGTILRFETSLQDTIRLTIKNKKDQEEVITSEAFFMVAFNTDIAIIKIIKEYGVSKTYIQRKLKKLNVTNNMYFTEDENKKEPKINEQAKNKTSKTPILDNFSRDLTVLATEDKLDPVIGRDNEVERVAQILSRRKKNNPILIGEPGVGKTSIAEGLALRIVKNECPRPLQNKRLVSLDLTSMVAGTKYRGQFEERIKGLIDEIKDNKDIILFIDEIHTLVGAGNSSGALDAANIFKPALARGEIQCIGATTLDEYRKNIEKDGALDRRFQKVIINAPSLEDAKTILMNIKDRYEDFHKVTYTDEAIDEMIRLADRYITNREFPDKAIDILDETGSRAQVNTPVPQNIKELENKLKEIKKEKVLVVKQQNFEKAADLRDLERKVINDLEKQQYIWKKDLETSRVVVNETMVCDVVSMMTGIPITKISQNEIRKLITIDKELANTIIGQDDAIEKVSWAIKRNRTGIRKQNKPIGSFLFIGPTGVGKTELAKVLTQKVFGAEDSMIRIDMSEYSEKFNISKLIGAPPGYVGYNEGGQLTEKVKNKPYSLILFDEIEKAHPDVFNVLLQLLDEGHLTDANGRKINFKNTIIIMTSNIGLKEVQDFGTKIGFSATDDRVKSSHNIIEKNLRKTFKPEFLNRLDEIVYFNYLDQDNILKIVDLQLTELINRVEESNYKLIIDDESKKYLSKLGYNKEYGAREIQRTIQKYLEDPISQLILENNIPKNGEFNILYDLSNDKLKITFSSN